MTRSGRTIPRKELGKSKKKRKPAETTDSDELAKQFEAELEYASTSGDTKTKFPFGVTPGGFPESPEKGK